MSETYKTKVNNNQEFELKLEDIEGLDVVNTKDNKYHIIQNNTSYKAKIEASNFLKKTYTIKVNSNTYEVAIKDELDQLINDMGFSLSASKHVNLIKAPMPGLILEIEVSEGQEIKENDTLLILEAMKMENIIVSPRDGVIKSISVEKGDAVEKNQLLIEFE